MNYAIETSSLSKEFIQRRGLSELFLSPFKKAETFLCVNNINLEIKDGEVFGLLGPNGAGKTTLIKILCCLILPTRGTAKVAGFDILKNEGKVKASIGLVSGDERSFYWRLTGRQNLHFFASLYNLSSKQAKVRIRELFDLLEIEEPDKRFQEYSTGIKQRLAIARSLLNNPRVIFMDEPTKSLDSISANNLRRFIKEKLVGEQKKTVFFTTHNLEEINELADRLAFMNKGKVKIIGATRELRQRIGNLNSNMEEIFNSMTREEN